MKLHIALLGASLMAFIGASQAQNPDKKLIDHTTYNGWKTLKNASISDNGKLVSYEIEPQAGDGYLYLYHSETGKLDSVSRGYNAQFSEDAKYLIYKIKPQFEKIRQAKIDKKKPSEFPQDSLGVIEISSGNVVYTAANIKQFSVNEESNVVAFLHSFIKYPEPPAPKKKKKKHDKPAPKIKSDGFYLEIYADILTKDPQTDGKKNKTKPATNPDHQIFKYVTEYDMNKHGNSIAFIQQLKVGDTDSAYVYFFDKKNKTAKRIHAFQGLIKTVVLDEKGEQLAFLCSDDTVSTKEYELWYWNVKNNSSSLVVDRNTANMPKDWCVSEFSALKFSKNGSRLFFGTAAIPVQEPKDTLPDDEKYHVDIWSHTDIRLQPEQLVNLDRDRKKNYDAVYFINENKMLQLADEKVSDIRLNQNGDGDFALGVAEKKYEKSKSWDAPVASDYYLVNVNTGAKTLVLENQKFTCRLSTGGKFIVYYKRKENQWYALEHSSGKTITLTEKCEDLFYEDDNGNPAEEDAIGLMGWSKGDEFIYIYGRYDIYKINPYETSKPVNITNGNAEKKQYRYTDLDKEEIFINPEYFLLHTFNEVNKKAGYASFSEKGLHQQIESDHKYYYVYKSKNTDRAIFARMSFTEYPDVQYGDLTFKNFKQISAANPQQKEYSWGTVELVHWTSYSGRKLQGLLYKPENFDSRRQYPLLVYFYEKYSDDIHNYYSPRPSASIINPTEYASNGYVVFIPDILYNEGTPGDDAYDCIVSGTDYIASLGFTDTSKMGLQGQSWGGYQTAYLVTRTNKYAAAMAGAPVSNMTSAYGGIRWGSGLSREFQYEKTQSRLGVNLWEDRERYIKNSPVFFADKVTTPLLIMHNDKDGAVPWYQGIEYFNALRRLDKTVWMLTYNEDDHNLRKRANQMDLSIRMRQFFDHYLLGQPMPEWMKYGLPALEKGKKTGYNLIDE